MVEHSAVNRVVTGSSPVRGVHPYRVVASVAALIYFVRNHSKKVKDFLTVS